MNDIENDLIDIIQASEEGQDWLDRGVNDLAIDRFISIGEAAKRVVDRLKASMADG